jgi:flagellar biosynthesis protein FlhG
MTDAYATIKVLATQQARREIGLVVNEVGHAGEGRVIHGQLQLVVDRFVAPMPGSDGGAPTLAWFGEVPLDPAVREAVQKRALLLELLPGSAAARAVHAIAAKLAP